MGPPASSSFALLGTALMLMSATSRPRRLVAILGVVVAFIMTVSLLGYLFSASQFDTIPWLSAIALPTTTMLLALGIGLIASVPEHSPMLLLRERSAAGTMVRWALPADVSYGLDAASKRRLVARRCCRTGGDRVVHHACFFRPARRTFVSSSTASGMNDTTVRGTYSVHCIGTVFITDASMRL